jgi:hypothetical protein
VKYFLFKSLLMFIYLYIFLMFWILVYYKFNNKLVLSIVSWLLYKKIKKVLPKWINVQNTPILMALIDYKAFSSRYNNMIYSRNGSSTLLVVLSRRDQHWFQATWFSLLLLQSHLYFMNFVKLQLAVTFYLPRPY